MRCDELKDLLPLHGLDLLTPEEEAAVRRHLDSGCPRCACEQAATRQAIDLLPFSLPADEPSPLAKARLMSRVRADAAPAAAPVRGRISWSAAAGIAVAAALVAAIGVGVLSRNLARGIIAPLRAQLEKQGEEMAALRQQIRAAQDSIRLVSGPGVLISDLAGQGPQATSSARLFWDRGRSEWQLFASNLPAPPQGKTYQLWFITATAKISAGTFEPAEIGAATGRFAAPPAESGTIVAAAVTDEPAGGSPQPTGSILLLGKI